MRRNLYAHKKLAAGLALSAAPVLAFASPAAAADAEGNDHEVTTAGFVRGGVNNTCEIIFGSQFEYDEETNTTWLRASNALSGTDPDCFTDASITQSFTETWLRINWSVNGQARASVSAETDGYGDHSLHVPIEGRPESIAVEHRVTYECIDDPQQFCVIEGTTNPK